MKNISLFLKITLSNTLILLSLIIWFTAQNNKVIHEQMKSLAYDKVRSIALNSTDVISINLTLGLDDSYKEAINKLLQNNEEIIMLMMYDSSNRVLYAQKDENSLSKKPIVGSVVVPLFDVLEKKSLGSLEVFYTQSSTYISVLESYQNFTDTMLFVFFIALILLSSMVYYSIKPLKKLSQVLASYTSGRALDIVYQEGRDEVSIISNTTLHMLEEIEKELQTRIAFEKELSHKSKLAAMGEMIDSIAHQWRQPLMNINAILMNIDRTYELKGLSQKYLDSKLGELTDITQHMSQTIDDFRGFFSKDKKKQTLFLDSIVQDSLSLLSASLRGVTLEIKVDTNIKVTLYKTELMQVIISLLNNALDALEQRDVKNIRIESHADASSIVLRIVDNAGGIKEENKERIFEPYFTTKHRYGGTGMGLYICKMIMQESLDGTIECENTDKGAMFSLTFPKT